MSRFLGVLILSFISLTACTYEKPFSRAQSEIIQLTGSGAFTKAEALINQTLERPDLTETQKDWLNVRKDLMERVRIDFSKSEERITAQLREYFPNLSDSLRYAWESDGRLEMRMIDGQKKYFSYAVNNLFRLDPDAHKIKYGIATQVPDPLDSVRLSNTSAILAAGQPGKPAEKYKVRIGFKLTINPDAVPPGETVRCWMPFPRISSPRQPAANLISSFPAEVIRSSEQALQSTLYATQIKEAGKPAIFSYEAEFEIAGQWFDPKQLSGQKPNNYTGGGEFTKETPPQVVFSPLVRHLADSLAGSETDPFKIFRSFYYWIDKEIPWASALEYSIIDCIPDYVITNRHGDCGMVTFLLMSMARYKGIPARWQSGWMLHPGNKNLHDWCELWFEGAGWVPVDMSFGLQKTDNPVLREFYMTGIDSYRMIINDDFGKELDPPKKFYRSEPYDFQRGEVEWNGGNLYFNQWDYEFNVLSLEKII